MEHDHNSHRPKGLDLSKITLSEHVKRQAVEKGISPAQVREALTNPYQVTDVQRYPGQKRYCGRPVTAADGTILPGVAVVVRGLHVITVYLDGVVTPLRPDQIDDPAARASQRLQRNRPAAS